MSRIRPSLRQLQKAERAAQPGPGFRSTIEAQRAAKRRVLERIETALDRINVASQFREFSASTIAQIGHAERFLRQGVGEPEGWPFTVSHEGAHELAQRLAAMLHDAYVAELMDRAQCRALADEQAEPTDD